MLLITAIFVIPSSDQRDVHLHFYLRRQFNAFLCCLKIICYLLLFIHFLKIIFKVVWFMFTSLEFYVSPILPFIHFGFLR